MTEEGGKTVYEKYCKIDATEAEHFLKLGQKMMVC